MHVSTCVCVCTCKCLCMCVCSCVCVHMCIWVCMHVFLHACMRVCMLCVHACIFACVRACVHAVCACVHVCVLVQVWHCNTHTHVPELSMYSLGLFLMNDLTKFPTRFPTNPQTGLEYTTNIIVEETMVKLEIEDIFDQLIYVYIQMHTHECTARCYFL